MFLVGRFPSAEVRSKAPPTRLRTDQDRRLAGTRCTFQLGPLEGRISAHHDTAFLSGWFARSIPGRVQPLRYCGERWEISPRAMVWLRGDTRGGSGCWGRRGWGGEVSAQSFREDHNDSGDAPERLHDPHDDERVGSKAMDQEAQEPSYKTYREDPPEISRLGSPGVECYAKEGEDEPDKGTERQEQLIVEYYSR